MSFHLNSLFNLKQLGIVALLAFSMIAIPTVSSVQADDDDVLTIGSVAPELDIEHWVSDRDGKMPKVTKFEKGKVYVVEFWATWCGPCIASMPHLAETQDKYADKGVQLISVSDESLEKVEKFLERDVRGNEDQTYAELTSVYCLTTDPDESVYEDYMRAAGQNGIPTAFIVGKTGHIEWIGHPMRMDASLDAVVNDGWDRDSFAKEFKREQRVELLQASVMRFMQKDEADKAMEKVEAFMKENAEDEMAMERAMGMKARIQLFPVSKLLRERENEEALEKLSKIIKDAKTDGDENLVAEANRMRSSVLFSPVMRTIRRKPEEALAKIDEILQSHGEDEFIQKEGTVFKVMARMSMGDEEQIAAFKDMAKGEFSSAMINQFAWGIVEKVQAGEEVDEKLLAAACEAAKNGVKLAKEEGSDSETAMILDTHANLLFHCDKLDEAIMVQKEAMKLSNDEQLKAFYEKLIEAKKKKEA